MEYLPATHVEQYELAIASAALPNAQSVQVEAPMSENFPAAQLVHDEDLTALIALPAAQLSQVLTPPVENVPAKQSVHDVEALAPTDLVPVAQVKQLDWDVVAVYAPPAHAKHDVAPLEE